MEEKQEFQLGDVFYLVCQDYKKRWILHKEIVKRIIIDEEGIYICSENIQVLQRLCGHTLAEAKEIAIKNFYQETDEQIKKIKNLTK